MVQLTYEQYLKHDTQDRTFFDSFASTAQSVLHMLNTGRQDQRPLTSLQCPDAMHLWFQIKLIKNEDPVNDVIFNTTSRTRWRNDSIMWKVRPSFLFRIHKKLIH